MNFARALSVAALLICSFSLGLSQTKIISLKDQHISCEPLRFHVKEIIDGRQRKTTIDISRNGINDLRSITDFSNGLDNEIMSLINQLKESGGQLLNVAMKIDNLKIEEATIDDNEYTSSLLTMDFFLVLDDEFYFIMRKSSYSRFQKSGITHHHDVSIAATVEKMLQDFNHLNLEDISIEEDPISGKEVASFQPQQLPPAAILNGNYVDAVYSSFYSFLNNEPEIIDGYEIENDDELKLYWIDQQNHRTKSTTPIYAIAYKGQLYKYHHKGFHLIEKRGDKLIFLGKLRPDPGKAMRNYATAGAVGLVTTSAKIAMRYEIDLATGELNELGYIRR